MTFDLTRLGWPNTATVLALALVPLLALAAPAQQPTLTAQAGQATLIAQSALLEAPATE